jgi:hypothetical protein
VERRSETGDTEEGVNWRTRCRTEYLLIVFPSTALLAASHVPFNTQTNEKKKDLYSWYQMNNLKRNRMTRKGMGANALCVVSFRNPLVWRLASWPLDLEHNLLINQVHLTSQGSQIGSSMALCLNINNNKEAMVIKHEKILKQRRTNFKLNK